MKKYPGLSEVELVEGNSLCCGCVYYYDKSMPECHHPVALELNDDLPDCIPDEIYKPKQPSK